VKASDFKPNSIFKMDGGFYTVVECMKVQQQRQAAFVKARIKNLETGAVKDKNFRTDEQFDNVEITRRDMKFSYEDGDLFYFIEQETWESEPVSRTMAESVLVYNSEVEGHETVYTFEYADGKLIRISPPTFVVLRVTETEPSVAGDTARNALKNATLETGLVIKVQMFINTGDRVKVDTRNGTYVERV